MKITKFLPILFLLLLPFLANAQDFIGSWTMSGPAPDGTTVTNTVTFNADGTMTVDFASDGKVDVRATYAFENGVVSVSDTGKESPCYGKVGKYRVKVSGDKCTASLVEDPCDERRGDTMAMTRKQ